MTKIVPEPIDFEIAEKVLTISSLLTKPSLLFVGDNGIGKSTMLKIHSSLNPSNLYVSYVDRGGLGSKEQITFLNGKGIKNIFLDDIERIISRKHEVSTSTVDSICDAIDGNQAFRMTFENKKTPDLKMPRLNFISACTYSAFWHLTRSRHSFEFLNRVVIFFIESSDGFHSEMADYDNKDKEWYYINTIPKIKPIETKLKMRHFRHKLMHDQLASGLIAFGFKKMIPMYFWEIDDDGTAELATPYQKIEDLAKLR